MNILRIKSRLEVAANIAVLVAAVVLLAFIGQQEYERRHHRPDPPSQASLVGQTIALPGVHFAPQSRTLILVISTTCHFCKDKPSPFAWLVLRVAPPDFWLLRRSYPRRWAVNE